MMYGVVNRIDISKTFETHVYAAPARPLRPMMDLGGVQTG